MRRFHMTAGKGTRNFKVLKSIEKLYDGIA